MPLAISDGTQLVEIEEVGVVYNAGIAEDVKPSNIKVGIKILGNEGNFTANGTQTAGQELATSDDIMEGTSAWVNGEEVLGNMTFQYFYAGTSEPAAQLGNDGDIYLKKANS